MKRFLNSSGRSEETPSDADPDLPKTKMRKENSFSRLWLDDTLLKPWLIEKPENSAFCKVCNTKLKASGGKKDLFAHVESAKHKNASKLILMQPNIATVFANKSITCKTKELELKLASFCAEHNLPLTCVDHVTKIFKGYSSDVIGKLKCGRTKTAAIIKHVLGMQQFSNLCKILKETKFSMHIDESTDRSNAKQLSVVARFSQKFNIKDCFFTILRVKSADAVSIYSSIKKILIENDIDYKTNLIGFAADGAAVMTGARHSVAKFLKDDAPNLVVLKCVCHSLNLVASAACLKIPNSIEQLTRDIYNYISNSPKRNEQFIDVQKLLEIKPKKILHPSQTRWLSLEQVVLRILELYDSLKIYFGFVVNVDQLESLKNILEKLLNPVYKLYFQFLSYILPLINNFNKLFQSESPQIHKLQKSLENTLHTILDNYMIRSYIDKTPISNIEFDNPSFFLPLKDIYLGATVNVNLSNSNINISDSEISIFQSNCRNFYIELIRQFYKRFNFDDDIIKKCSWIDPEVVMAKKCPSIAPLCSLFPNLIEESDISLIDLEWRELRNTNFTSYSFQQGVDVQSFWKTILKTERRSGEMAFPRLGKFVFEILTLPHSSASVERTFSQINLNKTKLRNCLCEDTINGILLTKDYLKLNGYSCHNVELNSSLLDRFNAKNMYKAIDDED